MTRSSINWHQIEVLYRAGNHSLRQLADAFKIPFGTINARCTRHKWTLPPVSPIIQQKTASVVNKSPFLPVVSSPNTGITPHKTTLQSSALDALSSLKNANRLKSNQIGEKILEISEKHVKKLEKMPVNGFSASHLVDINKVVRSWAEEDHRDVQVNTLVNVHSLSTMDDSEISTPAQD